MTIKRYHVWAVKARDGKQFGNLFQIGTGRTPEDIATIGTRRLIPRGMSDYLRMVDHELWLQVEDNEGFRSLNRDMMFLWNTARYSTLGKREAKVHAIELAKQLLAIADTYAWTFPPLEIGYLAYQSIARARWLPGDDRGKWVWHTASSFAEAARVTSRSSSTRIAARRGGRYYNKRQLSVLINSEAAEQAEARKAQNLLDAPAILDDYARVLSSIGGEVTVKARVIGMRERWDLMPQDYFEVFARKTPVIRKRWVEYQVSFGDRSIPVWVSEDRVTPVKE